MGKKFIPSSRRDNSPSRTLCLRPFGPSCDVRGVGPRPPQHGWLNLPFAIYDLRAARAWGHLPSFRNRKSQIVNRKSTRRVMGAWWPSRSSKPPLARFTGRGVFDSLPLRQTKGRIKNEECRTRFGPEQVSWPDILHSTFFLHFREGVTPRVARANS